MANMIQASSCRNITQCNIVVHQYCIEAVRCIYISSSLTPISPSLSLSPYILMSYLEQARSSHLLMYIICNYCTPKIVEKLLLKRKFCGNWQYDLIAYFCTDTFEYVDSYVHEFPPFSPPYILFSSRMENIFGCRFNLSY